MRATDAHKKGLRSKLKNSSSVIDSLFLAHSMAVPLLSRRRYKLSVFATKQKRAGAIERPTRVC
jgi:hypothetical protein